MEAELHAKKYIQAFRKDKENFLEKGELIFLRKGNVAEVNADLFRWMCF